MATYDGLVDQAIQKKEEEAIAEKRNKRLGDRDLGRFHLLRLLLNELMRLLSNSVDDNLRVMTILPTGEGIDYVECINPDDELVSLGGVEIVDPEVGRIDDMTFF
ncbi:hypothetical protein Tco_1112726 [Tanacetum coccineum]|uniref:Uncharacterized protein n=1 Tax=Tanacetum coccineum TaxID=301880 RepID=A0ABQ5IT57_9ASTR